jgi:hypothetical protein
VADPGREEPFMVDDVNSVAPLGRVAVGPSLSLPPMVSDSPAQMAVDQRREVQLAETGPRNPSDPVEEGIPFRRLSGIDLVVPARPAEDRSADGQGLAEMSAATPNPFTEHSLEGPDIAAREPEVEHLSLSIGSIEVVVDPPERPVAAAPAAAPPPVAVASRAVADPVMQLRRQYVTWPDVD